MSFHVRIPTRVATVLAAVALATAVAQAQQPAAPAQAPAPAQARPAGPIKIAVINTEAILVDSQTVDSGLARSGDQGEQAGARVR